MRDFIGAVLFMAGVKIMHPDTLRETMQRVNDRTGAITTNVTNVTVPPLDERVMEHLRELAKRDRSSSEPCRCLWCPRAEKHLRGAKGCGCDE